MKRILMLAPLLLLVLGAAGVGAAWKLGYLSIGPASAQAAEAAAEPAPKPKAHASSRRSEPKPGEGIMYTTKERVVNLADPGGMRYLKVAVVFELAPETEKVGPVKPEEYKKAQEELTTELAPLAPAIEDTITSVLSAKTSVELVSADGKGQLKLELKDKVNHLFEHDRVIAVYLTQFIIQ